MDARVTTQDYSPPAAAHPGMEWVRAVQPQAARSQAEGRPEELLRRNVAAETRKMLHEFVKHLLFYSQD